MNGQSEMPPDLDAELMLKVREGDEAAFRKLFENNASTLLGFVDRFFNNRAVSEEVVQEVLFRVYKARKKYEVRAKFSTWLYTIATRACFNELRRGVHRRKMESLNNEKASEPAGSAPTADEVLEGHRLQEKLAGILERLPENQRAAFLLVRFAGRTYDEVAGILGLTQSAVKSALFRATETIRQGLLGPQTEGSV